MCLLHEITLICSMPTFQEVQILEFGRLVRSCPRSLDAAIYDIGNHSSSASMRHLSRAANIPIYSFLAFSKAQNVVIENVVIDSIRSISRTANVVISISPGLSKPPNAAYS